MSIKSCNCFKMNEEQGIVFPTELVMVENGDSMSLKSRYVGESKFNNRKNPFVYRYCPLCGKKIEYDDEDNNGELF